MAHFNESIERAILSSILFNENNYEEIADQIKVKDFYVPAHKKIFESIEKLHSLDMPIDEEFIKSDLGKNLDYQVLADILSTTSIANIKAYTKMLKDLSIKRELIDVASEISKIVNDDEGKESQDILNDAQSSIYKISQNGSSKDFKNSAQITTETMNYIREMKERGNSYLIGEDTGFTNLNRMTTGFGKGDLIIVAARPAMGKTSFVLNIALRNLTKNRGVAFFSLEMPAEQLMLRLLSAKTSIPLQSLRVGDLNAHEWENLNAAIDELSKQNLFVDDGGSLNVNQLKTKMRKLKSKKEDIDLIIIDYLQLMMGTSNKDRHQEVSEISRSLKLLARELEVPIIALSQLNRGVDSRNDKRPMLSDLRESGAIEQDADVILFVYRDDVYREREEKEKEKKAKNEGKEYKSNFEGKIEEDAEIIIGKQRNGPIGKVKLIFQKKFTRFVDPENMPIESTEYIYKEPIPQESKEQTTPIEQIDNSNKNSITNFEDIKNDNEEKNANISNLDDFDFSNIDYNNQENNYKNKEYQDNSSNNENIDTLHDFNDFNLDDIEFEHIEDKEPSTNSEETNKLSDFNDFDLDELDFSDINFEEISNKSN